MSGCGGLHLTIVGLDVDCIGSDSDIDLDDLAILAE
jgi:hypothetical protein